VRTDAVRTALDFRVRDDTRAAFEDFADAERRRRFVATGKRSRW